MNSATDTGSAQWNLRHKLRRDKRRPPSPEDGTVPREAYTRPLSHAVHPKQSESHARRASVPSEAIFLPSSKLQRLISSPNIGEPRTVPDRSRHNRLEPETSKDRSRQTTAESRATLCLTRPRSYDRLNDPLGLTVLYEPETSPSSDIIFVHGLGGTSQGSWAKEHKPEHFWPEQWLPLEPDICSARILTFGYNANFRAIGSATITGILDFAKDLLYAMKLAKDSQVEDLEIGQVRCSGSSRRKKLITLIVRDPSFSLLIPWAD